ncbi:MAG: hypothetical protein QM698_03240 [Micropepsaceae bacterium]
MTPSQLARQHVSAALAEAAAAPIDRDATLRAIISQVVKAFLETKPLAEVQRELRDAADHADPDEDFTFMRP